MTMNFFKKVITFFSALWNAILWRKNDKNAKHTAKSAKVDGRAVKDSNPIVEAETFFVDVPLDSPEASELTEQETLLSEEISAAFPPMVARNIESGTPADPGIGAHSSGIEIRGFEGETSSSVSFFSEHTHVNEEPRKRLLSSKEKINELDEGENLISEPFLSEPAIIVDAIILNHVNEVFDVPPSEELPTPPSEFPDILERSLKELKAFSELTGLDDPPFSSNLPSSTSQEIPQVTVLGGGASLGIHPSIENMESVSRDHSISPKGKINPDLNYLAVGDDIHLFYHDGVEDIFTDDEKCVKSEMVQENETCEPAENDAAFIPKMTETSEMGVTVSKGIEVEKNPRTSNTDIVVISGSNSSTRAITDINEDGTDDERKYSTNYMVKSDSLVNFLPASVIDPELDDTAGLNVILETAEKILSDEQEKEVSFGCSNSVIQEGGLQEIMCTPRGVLKLAGDHHLDWVDENEFPKQNHDVTAHDLILDTFSFEEPQAIAHHHLEGIILEETLQSSMTDESPMFQEILKTVETGLEDSESVDGLDAVMNNEYLFTPDAIGRCKSIIQDCPENEEDRKSPCPLRQFSSFHLDDEPGCRGHQNITRILAPGIPTVGYGVIQTGSGLSDCVCPERNTNSPNHSIEEGSTEQFMVDSQNSGEFLDSPVWRGNLPFSESETLTEIKEHDPNCLPLFSKRAVALVRNQEVSHREVAKDRFSHAQHGTNTDDYHPFIDCAAYLFRIPEEIRKETSFNPCVGAGPFRRSFYSNNANHESARYSDEQDVHSNKNPVMSSVLPNFVGAVPLINPTPEEYKNRQMSPDGYNQTLNVGTFWGTHPGIAHSGDQQQAFIGYPVSSGGNNHKSEDFNVLPTATYENGHTGRCTNSAEDYRYINPYGEVEFPMTRLPLCIPHSQSAFMPRGTLAPVVFPIGPMNVPDTENPASFVNLDGIAHDEQYSVPCSWAGYQANAHSQNSDEEGSEITSGLEMRGVALESLGFGRTNDENDDLDNAPIPDPYFNLTENNSLHTVKSKADSYSGSLFCESLRSLISHNTENESIFPSFSCSSVQGCCPSIVLQSCETAVSNDSLQSIIVEETDYSKSVDEDYLATEKFMNDVNTALNESVLEQMQGKTDLCSNLLGRGDGSMSMAPGQSGQRDQRDAQENDAMLRNSLGENISVNNSKLTLLDGVLGAETGRRQTLELDEESSFSVHEHFREVLDSLLENVLTTVVDSSTSEVQIGIAEASVDCRENLAESPNHTHPDTDLVVQSMMFIEGMSDELRGLWNKGHIQKLETTKNDEMIVTSDEVVEVVGVSGVNDGKALMDSRAEIENALAWVDDDIPYRRSRRNRRRRKKVSGVESGTHPEQYSEITDIPMGDGVGTPHGLLMVSGFVKAEEDHPISCKPQKIRTEGASSNPVADREKLADEVPQESSKCEQNLSQIEDEGDGHYEDGDKPGESSGNPSNNRRRRNRRRKRKN